MLDIGLLALDTSHSERFADILTREFDARVTAVWDSGDVRDEAYVSNFCATYDATRYATPGEMVHAVDAAMILSVNWDRHWPLSAPFLKAGVPTLIDKPIAGTASDVVDIERAAREGGAPLFGGSAVPFHPSLGPLRRDEASRTTWSVGYNSPFYYGSHIVDTVRHLTGDDWVSVEPAAAHENTVTVSFHDGSVATLKFDGRTENPGFGFLDIATQMRAVTIESTPDALDQMYRPFLEGFIETVRGERDDREQLIDAARLLLGIQAALDTGDCVRSGDEAIGNVDVDGDSFTDAYEPYY